MAGQGMSDMITNVFLFSGAVHWLLVKINEAVLLLMQDTFERAVEYVKSLPPKGI